MNKSSGKFKSGFSPNPKGRPKGSPDRRSEFRALFESKGKEVIEKCIQMAIDGNETCMRLVIDRLCARLREEGDKTEGQTVLEMLQSGKLILAE